MHPDPNCTCLQAPSKVLTPTIIVLSILCRMRSLSDPGDDAGEGGEPEYGIDDVDERVEVHWKNGVSVGKQGKRSGR